MATTVIRSQLEDLLSLETKKVVFDTALEIRTVMTKEQSGIDILLEFELYAGESPNMCVHRRNVCNLPNETIEQVRALINKICGTICIELEDRRISGWLIVGITDEKVVIEYPLRYTPEPVNMVRASW